MDAAEMPVMKKIRELNDALSSCSIVVGWMDENGSLQTARSNLRYRELTGRQTNAIAKEPSRALIAATLNYGREAGTTLGGRSYPAIPARPFMKFAAEIFKTVFPKEMRRVMPMYLSGKLSVDGVLKSIGERAKESVQEAIRTGDYAPLSERTIAAKGSSTPLIDTGKMVESVSFEIRRE